MPRHHFTFSLDLPEPGIPNQFTLPRNTQLVMGRVIYRVDQAVTVTRGGTICRRCNRRPADVQESVCQHCFDLMMRQLPAPPPSDDEIQSVSEAVERTALTNEQRRIASAYRVPGIVNSRIEVSPTMAGTGQAVADAVDALENALKTHNPPKKPRPPRKSVKSRTQLLEEDPFKS